VQRHTRKNTVILEVLVILLLAAIPGCIKELTFSEGLDLIGDATEEDTSPEDVSQDTGPPDGVTEPGPDTEIVGDIPIDIDDIGDVTDVDTVPAHPDGWDVEIDSETDVGNTCFFQEDCGDGHCGPFEDFGCCPQDCWMRCYRGATEWPDCSDRECGDDGAGGKCGPCPDSKECVDRACHWKGMMAPALADPSTNTVHTTTMQAPHMEAGATSVIESGAFAGAASLHTSVLSKQFCKVSCEGRNCGPDDCSGTCGDCLEANEGCNQSTGQCVGLGPVSSVNPWTTPSSSLCLGASRR